MQVRFKATSKVAGEHIFYKDFENEQEFNAVIQEQENHYKELGKLDKSLTVTATVVKKGTVVYFNQLV